MGIVVIVAYKPKPDKADALKQVMKTHIPILKKEGLVTDREPIVMEAADGTIVEVFEWLSNEAIQNAHKNPEVLKMWQAYFDACDVIPLNFLSEATSMFASFKPFN
ncbi:MAG TPA: hypothetical protein VGI43_04285 [Mucilaginibacter sp.]|jgi:quinol monooxygenase YgiN